MNENVIITVDKNLKDEIEIHTANIRSAIQGMAKAWLTIAINIRELKSKMDGIGDRKTNWKAYTDTESFGDFCESRLQLSDKAVYQYLSGLEFIENNRPEIIEAYNKSDQGVLLPDYTKVRLLAAKEEDLHSRSEKSFQSVTDKVFDNSISRRELENEIKEILKPTPSSESEQVIEAEVEIVKPSIAENMLKNASATLLPHLEKGDTQAVGKWVSELLEKAKGKTSTRVENQGIRRIIVANSAKDRPYTEEVIKRARKINPEIDVIFAGSRDDKDCLKFPPQLNPHGKYWYSKESLILRDRGTSTFVETFPSPGVIVENLGTMLKLGFHCSSTCEYCYLQGGKYPHQELFTNLDRVKEEINIETYVHPSILSVWSAYSFHEEKRTDKIPVGLNDIGNKLRNKFHKLGIISDGAAIDYLKRNIDSYLVELGVNIDNAKLADVKSDITKYYNENKKRKLSMNIGEYTDIIGNDPYSGHMKFVYDEIIDKHKNVHLAIWTKSANFDEVLKHDGQGRIKFTFGLNTPTIIDKYEHGTASLEDRLNGIKKIQGRGGYDIRLCIEPIINYDGCESEYVELVDKVMKSIDPSNVSKIILGSTRFRKDMVRNIRKNHPWTTLFNNMEEFEEYDPNDKRLRYSEEFRIKIYKKLIDAIRKHTRAKITLGAEIPEMWDWVGLDRKKFMKDKVYQYPG